MLTSEETHSFWSWFWLQEVRTDGLSAEVVLVRVGRRPAPTLTLWMVNGDQIHGRFHYPGYPRIFTHLDRVPYPVPAYILDALMTTEPDPLTQYTDEGGALRLPDTWR